jgi:DNA-binding protein HU-beta
MTKAEIVTKISEKTGIEKLAVQAIVESLMEHLKGSMIKGENVYLRGFGSFILKQRAAKTGRNISKNTTVQIPAHSIPAFKPSREFKEEVSAKVAVK